MTSPAVSQISAHRLRFSRRRRRLPQTRRSRQPEAGHPKEITSLHLSSLRRFVASYTNGVLPGIATDGVGRSPNSYASGLKSSDESSACSQDTGWPVYADIRPIMAVRAGAHESLRGHGDRRGRDNGRRARIRSQRSRAAAGPFADRSFRKRGVRLAG